MVLWFGAAGQRLRRHTKVTAPPWQAPGRPGAQQLDFVTMLPVIHFQGSDSLTKPGQTEIETMPVVTLPTCYRRWDCGAGAIRRHSAVRPSLDEKPGPNRRGSFVTSSVKATEMNELC